MEQTQKKKSAMNQQQQNRCLRVDSRGGGGVNALYWYKIFSLDSVVIKTQKILSSHGGFLAIAIYHQREQINTL